MVLKKLNLIRRSISLFLIFFLIGCSNNQNKYYIAAGSEGTSYYNVGKNIAEIVSSKSGIDVSAISDSVRVGGKTLSLGALNNCLILSEGKADFAITQNDVLIIPPSEQDGNPKYPNLQSVTPLYSEIFFIIYKKSLKPESLRDLIISRKVLMGPEDSGTTQLTKSLFKEFGIEENEYEARYVDLENIVLSDSIDICCLVTGFDNIRIQKSLERGGKIFSLGDWRLAGKGSAADGFCLEYPMAKPYIIPKNVFSDLPEEPVLTVAIDAILLTREDIGDDVVYDFLQILLTNKQFLVFDLDNKLLSQLTEKFDPLKMRFPLHSGAKRYLERDKPTFLERYAESLGFGLSIVIALIGAIAYLVQWSKQRKKNRIDDFYKEIINIQNQIKNYTSIEACETAIDGLKDLRHKAFDELIDEKLRADESFRIFITFIQDTQNEIEQQINELEKSG